LFEARHRRLVPTLRKAAIKREHKCFCFVCLIDTLSKSENELLPELGLYKTQITES